MKLYEFNFIDNKNLNETALLESVESFLVRESEEQNWASGYNFRQNKPIESLADGTKKYSFEVLGNYVDSNDLDSESNAAQAPSSISSIAAREVDL